MHEHQSSVEKF